MIMLLIDIALALNLILTTCLIVGWVMYVRKPAVQMEEILNKGGYFLLLVFGMVFAMITMSQQQLPILNPGQVMLFLAGMTWCGHCILQILVKQRILSLLPLCTIMILTTIAISLGLHITEITFPPLIGIRSAIHVTLAMLGLSMLIGSGVFATGYLIMNHQLKTHRFGVWFKHLPSLMDMNRLRIHSLFYGWMAITLLILIAFIWTLLTPSNSHVVPSHVHPTLTIWVAIGVLVTANRLNWLKPHTHAIVTLVMAVIILGLIFVSLIEFFSGRFL